MDPDAVEIRVLGCLLEKQRTTPDAYPLTLNSLRLACNQATNRDPVVDYDEQTIRDALARLRERRWVRVASMPGRRTVKYRHLADEALGLDGPGAAVLAVLLLRGPQTPGELKQRAERLHPFAGLDAIESALEGLAGRGLVRRLDRQPGEKQQRFEQALGGDRASGRPATEASGGGSRDPATGLEVRVEALERAVDELRAALETLRR